MQKNSNRKGLALGAIFALVASLFATAPAAQANEAGLVVEPIVGTSYTMVNTEDFILTTRLGSQVQSDRAAALKYIIQKSGTIGYGLSISHTVSPSLTAMSGLFPAVAGNSTMSSMITSSTISVVAAPDSSGLSANRNQLRIQPWTTSASLTSVSPAISVTVTAFLDLNNDGLATGSEPSTSVTVNFVALGNIGGSVTLTQPVAGDTRVTASFALTTVNHQQLSGSFNYGFISSVGANTTNATATSSGVTAAVLSDGNFSASVPIVAATASALIAQSISAVLYYGAKGDDTVVRVQRLGVSGSFAFDGVTFSAVVGNNLVVTGTSADAMSADIRVNSQVELAAWAFTGSKAAVSATQASSMWFQVSGLSTEKYIIVNGVTYTNSATLPTESTAIAIAAGTKAAITLTTFGFNGLGSEVITFTQKAVNRTATVDLTVERAAFALSTATGLFAVVAPGASSAFSFDVKDQFDVLSNRVNQRVAGLTFASDFSTSTTVSTAVVAGKATVTVTTLPATKTGSATARFTLQAQNSDTGTWENVNTVEIALAVTTSPSVFAGAVSPSTSNVSVSYDVYSWSGNVTVPTNVAGAVVTITATGLVIKAGDVTASNTLVARSASTKNLVLNFAGSKAGTYTVSYSVGSSTTTSQVVVQPAVVANASTVNLSATTLVPGQTNTIVATLVDKNGNGIETAAGLVLAYSGKGLPFNLTGATDEDGKITFQVLVLAGETGTGTVTATIKPTGAAKDNITVVRTLTIVPPAVVVVPVPEINAVIGTFNGRWAVRVENAKGAVVSVKVGNRWVKYTSLNDNYLFSRQSRVGATLPVAVYVNGQLENVATLTIK
jgi:trimeric autotransporter adhesin